MNFGGFSLKRALGITAAKQKVSKAIGIPLSKSGREQKIGRVTKDILTLEMLKRKK